MINKNATVTDMMADSNTTINKAMLNSIKAMANDPKWIKAMKELKEKEETKQNKV